MKKTLAVITGPTASGKTALAIAIARELGCEILSADSRQIYRGIEIGTASPSREELEAVPHHFIGTLELTESYSAARYAEEADALMRRLWQKGDYVVMCGGSMMYIDAVVNGIDSLPTVSDEVRRQAWELYENHGLDGILAELDRIDPVYAARVDRANHRRIIHAIEVTRQAGRPYSSLLTGKRAERPYRIVKLAIDYPREELFDRINRRVDAMIAAGFEQEARQVWPLRHLNSLNTVGFKEMFAMFESVMDRDTAIARMKKNTRVYAKKQLTWLRRDPSVVWLDPRGQMLGQALAAICSDGGGEACR